MTIGMSRAAAARLSALVVVAAVLAGVTDAQAGGPSPLDHVFGSNSVASHNWDVKANPVVQWKGMAERFKTEQAQCYPAAGCEKFKALVQSLAGLSIPDELQAVRRAEIEIPYVEDMQNYQKADQWATPYEMLSIGSGDAEDFAILSYYALRAAGMPASALRVLAVRLNHMNGFSHALLAVDIAPEPQILDNRVARVTSASLTKTEYTPVLGFNEEAWWLYLKPTQ